jgi:transposase-like protein
MVSAAEDPVRKVSAAAKYLGVHPNTMRWWRRHNRGPASQLRGSHHVYRQSALDDWLANGDPAEVEQAS